MAIEDVHEINLRRSVESFVRVASTFESATNPIQRLGFNDIRPEARKRRFKLVAVTHGGAVDVRGRRIDLGECRRSATPFSESN